MCRVFRYKVKDKYGASAVEGNSDEESESSTDYSSEDSNAEFVTPQVDVAILKIISRIREGDKSIYTNDKDFFDGTASSLGKPIDQRFTH